MAVVVGKGGAKRVFCEERGLNLFLGEGGAKVAPSHGRIFSEWSWLLIGD